MPTAAEMMIPTEASVSPVNVFWNRVVLVALPSDPKSMPLATVCKLAAMIKAISTQMTKAVIAITSAIRTCQFLPCDCFCTHRKYIKSYMEIDDTEVA